MPPQRREELLPARDQEPPVLLEQADDEEPVFEEVLEDDDNSPLQSEWLQVEELEICLRPGDLVEFRRVVNFGNYEQRVYSHWAMYTGRVHGAHTVIHAAGNEGDFAFPGQPAHLLPRKAEIRLDALRRVAGDDVARLNNIHDTHSRPLHPRVAVRRGELALARKSYDYHIILSNCEHFVKWCRYGEHTSDQAILAQAALYGTFTGVALGAFKTTRPIAIVAAAAVVVGYGISAKYGRQIMRATRKVGAAANDLAEKILERRHRFAARRQAQHYE